MFDNDVFDINVLFQLRIVLMKKNFRKQFVVYIKFHYHKNKNDIIFEFQRFVSFVVFFFMIFIKMQKKFDKLTRKKIEQKKRKSKIENTLLKLIFR